jgi:phosphomannomutase
MLGVSGLRGIVGKSLTPEVAARYAAAVGGWLVQRHAGRTRPQVAIACDGRAGAPAVVAAATAGLLASGCDVVPLGVAMTPTVGAVVDALGLSAGVQVSASHNPQQWNGLKIVVREAGLRAGRTDACAPSAAAANQIIERFRGPIAYAEWDHVGELDSESSHAEAHTDAVMNALSAVAPARKIKNQKFEVALDSVGGAGGVWTADFLERQLGCHVRAYGPHTDGLFTHTPEPTRENLEAFSKTVRTRKAQVGFAQDPDADRLAVIDEKGRYIGEEYTLALAAEALLGGRAAAKTVRGRKPRPHSTVLVANLSTSRMIDDVAARYGARVVRTAVGEANVVEAMKRERAAGADVVLGGEGNGGVIWPAVTYIRDSIGAMALVLWLMSRTGKTVSELVAAAPAYSIEKRKVDLARKEHARPAVEKLAAAYGDARVDLQDGIRIDWDDRRAWLHVRASNTEPIMRLIAEAPDSGQAAAILDDAARIIGG